MMQADEPRARARRDVAEVLAEADRAIAESTALLERIHQDLSRYQRELDAMRESLRREP